MRTRSVWTLALLLSTSCTPRAVESPAASPELEAQPPPTREDSSPNLGGHAPEDAPTSSSEAGGMQLHLGPLPPKPASELPKWARGVCPKLQHAKPIPLPSGAQWPLPASWWTRERASCSPDAYLDGEPGDELQCYPDGPYTRWYDGKIDQEYYSTSEHGVLRSRTTRGACEVHETQLNDESLLSTGYDGSGTARAEMTVRVIEYETYPIGCVRSWDADGELLQISYWTKKGFQKLARRPGAPPPTISDVDYDVGEYFTQLERDRIQDHLRRVEIELRAVDTSSMPAQTARARRENLDRLRDYWVRGEFPRLDTDATTLSPVFIDDRGTACAVGHLMQASGHAPLAQAIAAREKYEFLADIDTPGVREWIEQSGLTAEEHARIQPSYCEPECAPDSGFVCLTTGKTMQRCYYEQCRDDVEIAHEGPCYDYSLMNPSDCS